MSYQQTVRVTNPHRRPIELWVEPWGDLHQIAPGESVDLTFRAAAPGLVEVQAEDDKVIVFGWPGSTVALHKGGELIEDYDNPVPGVPEDMNVSDFLRTMFGRQPPGPEKS